jgi:hypothetical protein
MHRELVTEERPPIGAGHDDMARQHRAVRIEVSELRAMIDSRRATQRTDAYRHMLAVLVGRLRERLILHFELEEEGARVARLRAAHPALAADLERFATAHAALLADAAHLAMQLRTPTAPPDVVARTMDWLDALLRHEQGEDQFLATLGAD